jgi:dihydrolipoamide dehydrogenase
MNKHKFDLVVFGGGGGLAVAMTSSRRGMKVALIEKGPLGGTCVNRGCIPSKLLIEHADLAERIRSAGRFHIDASITGMDQSRILTETLQEVTKSASGIAEHLPDGLTFFNEKATFKQNCSLDVAGDLIEGEKILVAVGARPRLSDIPGLADMPVMTSNDVFKLEEVPKSLVIVGGGYISTELGFFFSEMGTEVTIIDRNSTLLHREDGEISAIFTEQFRRHAELKLDHTVSSITYEDDQFEVVVEHRERPGESSTLIAEKVLFAAGRVPNSDRIGIENTDLELDERGFINVDGMLKTNVANVWAMGDIVGKHLFTHAASYQAEHILGQFFDGRDDPIDYEPMPHAVFSSPQIAGVGYTEEQLKERAIDYKTGTADYTSAAMGRALKTEAGLVKFLVDSDGKILGCHIIGPEASILIHEVIPIMKWKNNIRSVTGIIHIHPALNEVVRNAARKALAAVQS